MSRRLATSLTFVLALSGAVLLGCGNSEDGDRPEDRAQIEALVADLNEAIRKNDPSGWCRVFSPSSVNGVFGSTARCRRETAQVLKSGGSPESVAIADIAFVDETARVSFDGRAGDANVVLEDGKWYFSLDQQVDPAGNAAQTEGVDGDS